jgi:integrase
VQKTRCGERRAHQTRNPCSIRGAGIERTRERPLLDTTIVLALADTIEPRLGCLILLGGFGGAPVNCSACNKGIDPLHGTVMVVRQAHEITGPGRVFTPPKSDAGRRSVALPAFVLEALAEHLRHHVGDAVDAWVFTPPSGLPLRRALSSAWRDACAALGLEGIRPHDLFVTARRPSSPAIPT